MDILTNLNLKLKRKLNNEGKNSSVYIMQDTQLNADMVVKCIPKIDFLNPDEYFNEAAIIYDIQHPNIVRIQHATDDNNSVYFSMPFYKNGSLESLMGKRFLTVKEIIEISLDYMNGLHYVHTKKLIHFDIKPTNILIDDNGKALLTDFGLSKYVNNYGMAYPDKIYPFHVPPEMLKGSLMSNKADIYQLGMTLYRMCNGNENYYEQIGRYKTETQFEDDVINGKFPKRDYFLPHIPKKMRKIIKRAMHVNPDERYLTVLDIANEMSTIDKNLNIVYNLDKNICSETWEYANSQTHIHRITLKKNGKYWTVLGEKIRVSDNHKTNIPSFCSDGHTKRANTLKQIEKIFKNL